MATITNVTKFMVIVETKNYPVVTIRPSIARYSKIRKKMNASEIAQCLTCYANVTLEKNNGTTVKLTANNFKSVLKDYAAQLNDIETNKAIAAEERKNTEKVEKIKEETVTTTSAPMTTTATPVTETVAEPENQEQNDETVQPDPEDEDTFDSTPYYNNDDDND